LAESWKPLTKSKKRATEIVPYTAISMFCNMSQRYFNAISSITSATSLDLSSALSSVS
jgi:hypothetical protein